MGISHGGVLRRTGTYPHYYSHGGRVKTVTTTTTTTVITTTDKSDRKDHKHGKGKTKKHGHKKAEVGCCSWGSHKCGDCGNDQAGRCHTSSSQCEDKCGGKWLAGKHPPHCPLNCKKYDCNPDFSKEQACQCNDGCEDYDSCCLDYDATCAKSLTD